MNIEKPKSSQPIPENAKKVFAGKMFEVYQWEQQMYDGSKQIFEKVQRADTVDTIAFTQDGKIILLEQEQPGKNPFFGLPGGRIDEGEDVLAAAKRELLEETGYECEGIELWHSFQPTSKVEWACYYMVAKNCKKIAEQELDGGEKIKVHLVDMEEFVEKLLTQKLRDGEIVMQFLKNDLMVIDKEKTIEKIKKHFK